MVSALGFAGAVFFMWRALLREWRFVRLARRISVRRALRRRAFVTLRQAYHCATDPTYYLSRVSLMICMNLVAATAVIFASVGLAAGEHSSGGSEIVATGALLLFVLFFAWSVARISKLARRVLRVRRKLRAVDARKRQRSCGPRPVVPLRHISTG
ncbi:hypothetical protein ACFQPG_05535 [Sphingomonas sp. GCM10030256]|uniref:hypothetical protein n=1 Tax=Sphingomonas sp. GCM10030256 TaxID=3273427 RepID=UPI0036123C33